MAKSSTKDMTTGRPMTLILGFAVPLFFGMLFQQVYSLVDSIIVGQFLGVKALAAVGSTGSINFLIIGFCNGLCSGFALPVAQRFGARDEKGLRKFVGNSAVLSIIFGVIITFLTSFLCYRILVWTKTPDDIIQMAYDYIFVIFVGIPCIMLYNLLSGYIRSLGDSITPVVFLTIAAVLNIVLDLLFILVFQQGVRGAALATVVSQGVSGVLCLVHIIRKFEILHLQPEDWVLEKRYTDTLLMMGLPMGFQYSITAIGSVILQTSVNTLGSSAVAAMTAAGKVSMFFVCPFDALGATMATYCGQNVGAGKLDRLSKGLNASSLLGAIYSAVAFVVIYFLAVPMLHLFVKSTEVQVIHDARNFLLINVAFYFGLALVNIVRFAIQGMGFSVFAVFAGVFEMIARAVVGIVFVPIFGFWAACFASPAAWVLADAFLIPAFVSCVRKLKRIQEEHRKQVL